MHESAVTFSRVWLERIESFVNIHFPAIRIHKESGDVELVVDRSMRTIVFCVCGNHFHKQKIAEYDATEIKDCFFSRLGLVFVPAEEAEESDSTCLVCNEDLIPEVREVIECQQCKRQYHQNCVEEDKCPNGLGCQEGLEQETDSEEETEQATKKQERIPLQSQKRCCACSAFYCRDCACARTEKFCVNCASPYCENRKKKRCCNCAAGYCDDCKCARNETPCTKCETPYCRNKASRTESDDD